MGSLTHTQGLGTSLALLGRRNLPALFGAQAQRTADNRFVIYVQDLGNGMHAVKNPCNDQVYTVGAIAGNLSFAKGQVVVLGSNAGNPGEVILGVAPPNLAGAETLVQNVSVAGAPYRVVNPRGTCPSIIPPLKSYLALGTDGAASHASTYTDGAHVHQYPDADTLVPVGAASQRIHSAGDTVLSGGDDTITQWHITSGLTSTLTLTGLPADGLGPPLWDGMSSGCWRSTASVFPDRHMEAQMYFFPFGATGTHALSDYTSGGPFVSAGPYATADEVFGSGFPYRLGIIPTGPDLQMVAQRFDLGREVLLRFQLGSLSWSTLESRIAPANAAGGNGLVITSNRGAVSTGLQISVVPGGLASPPHNVLPVDWTILGALGFSVSPDKFHFGIYPFYNNFNPWRLLRMPIQGVTVPTGCPIPAVDVDPAPWGSAWESAGIGGPRPPTVMLARD